MSPCDKHHPKGKTFSPTTRVSQEPHNHFSLVCQCHRNGRFCKAGQIVAKKIHDGKSANRVDQHLWLPWPCLRWRSLRKDRPLVWKRVKSSYLVWGVNRHSRRCGVVPFPKSGQNASCTCRCNVDLQDAGLVPFYKQTINVNGNRCCIVQLKSECQ